MLAVFSLYVTLSYSFDCPFNFHLCAFLCLVPYFVSRLAKGVQAFKYLFVVLIQHRLPIHRVSLSLLVVSTILLQPFISTYQ